MPDLRLTLSVHPLGLHVRWRLDGLALDDGDVLGELPVTVAGAPAVELEQGDVRAWDVRGELPLDLAVVDGPRGERVRAWTVRRSSDGAVELSYVARAATGAAPPVIPPLELRREHGGLSGALACFVLAPPEDDLRFELQWEPPAGEGSERWRASSSLGDGLGLDGELAGRGSECLRNTYVMAGDLLVYRHGHVSVSCLTRPAFELAAFSADVAATHQSMAATFGAPERPYRVYLRPHAGRGIAASAHPASFVAATNPAEPVDVESEQRLRSTIAHELVHEWLHLDDPVEDTTWFDEGAADYFALTVPLRHGLLAVAAFAREVNLAARHAYASPLRDLNLADAAHRYWTDFRAHRLPYARGMLYLADLDAAARRGSAGESGVDELVRRLLRRQGLGERVGIGAWCQEAASLSGRDERRALESLVLDGTGRPGPQTFAPALELVEVDVPVLDLGMDVAVFATRRVTGLVAGGAADRAGLREGDLVDLPRYSEALMLDVGDSLDLCAHRGTETLDLSIPLGGEVVRIPQWRPASTGTTGRP